MRRRPVLVTSTGYRGLDRGDSSRRGSRTGLQRAHLLASVALAAIAINSSVSAQTINTTGQWNGISSESPWGLPNTATYGQTITATSTQTRLSSFTFELSQTSGIAPQYQAFGIPWPALSPARRCSRRAF
jgi:hypothetical protein